MIRDPATTIAACCIAANIAALFFCGSRGGILSTVFGFCVLIPLVSARKKLATAGGVIVACLVFALATVFSFGMELTTIRRISQVTPRQFLREISESTRIRHWHDSWAAAVDYLPFGSGGGTYRYAYLPYQDLGDNQTFANADNLYLELMVEQGVPGILLAAMLFGTVVFSLSRLRHSIFPIDRALCATGWFAVAVVGTNAIVDFGLLLSSNAYFFAILVSVIVARAALCPCVDSHATFEHPDDLATAQESSPWMRVTFCAVGLAASLFALGPLRSDALIDHAVAKGRMVLRSDPWSRDQLEPTLQLLNQLARSDSNADLDLSRARCLVHLARVEEIESMKLDTLADLEQATNATRLGRRSTGLLPEPPAIDTYTLAASTAVRALQENPLSVEARLVLIQTDFLPNREQTSLDLLRQISTLQTRNSDLHLRLAELAVVRNAPRLAESFLHQATTLRAANVPDAINLAIRSPTLELDRCISLSPASRRRSVHHVLALLKQTPNSSDRYHSFIKHSIDFLDCDAEPSRAARAKCHYLKSRALFEIDLPMQAEKANRLAIELVPTERTYHIGLILGLIKHGKFAAAMEAATAAEEALPEDSQLEQLIRHIEHQIDQNSASGTPNDNAGPVTGGDRVANVSQMLPSTANHARFAHPWC
ncbi:O-antigen ligase family protein [Roseiconus nitratireducens]|uniref:O-antigen ligase family protein n=1 Tax=Roseiconus nitratireducens TaxID=2605748 RepID=UPI001F25FD0A|nr:O-antigen ligase family protein [Roseiconus nitratireducens]